MGKNTRFIGLDVHAETIAVAVAAGRDQVRSLATIANRPEAVRRLLGKLGKLTELKVCYEAGPTGYTLYWQSLREGRASDELHRHGAVRALKRTQDSARSHHQDRKLASAARPRRICLALPSSTSAVQATEGHADFSADKDRNDRVGCAGASPPPLLGAIEQEQAQRKDRHRACARARWIRPGHRCRNRALAQDSKGRVSF